MKKNIVILGSTGSIGKTLLNIINKDKNKFNIKLLTANKNYKNLLKQSKKFNVKNLIVTDFKSFNKARILNKNKSVKIYNNFENLDKILNKKIDYTMSSIVGIDGLLPTLKIIKYSNKIAIANKEAIICGWDLIKSELNKNKTIFMPVDSEHYSIWEILNSEQNSKIEKIYITASGGPFFKKQKKKLLIQISMRH